VVGGVRRRGSLEGKSMADRSFCFHRVFKAKPERVYRAFLDFEALVKWVPPYGFICNVDYINATVGGTFRISFKNFTTGNSHSFGGEYLELVPLFISFYVHIYGSGCGRDTSKGSLCGSYISLGASQ
jgi:hypothetical protein